VIVRAVDPAAADLPDGIGMWFTGRDPAATDPPVGRAGNLSHRRPHVPAYLARDRARLGTITGVTSLELMHQVHGAAVGVVTAATPTGAELRGVDALVTAEPDRALAVQVADCVPILLASAGGVGAVHAGRRGVAADVVGAAVGALGELAGPVDALRAVIGPAIGGCCYEVPEAMHDEIVADHPAAAATTTWGTPALDLPAAVAARLRQLGVARVHRAAGCTACEPGWFSHRRDPEAGRQLGVVVRREAA
jgi:polyphenol oxidase